LAKDIGQRQAAAETALYGFMNPLKASTVVFIKNDVGAMPSRYKFSGKRSLIAARSSSCRTIHIDAICPAAAQWVTRPAKTNPELCHPRQPCTQCWAVIRPTPVSSANVWVHGCRGWHSSGLVLAGLGLNELPLEDPFLSSHKPYCLFQQYCFFTFTFKLQYT
jgi:hypothetical protein